MSEEALSDLPEDAVVLGRFGKAHGLKGEVRFSPFGCDLDIFRRIAKVFLGSQVHEARVARVREAGKYWIVGLEGVGSRAEAEALKGLVVWIRESQLPPLAESELYVASVIDAEVRDERGRRMGVVVGVMETGENDVLVVRRDDGEEELIPALRSVLTEWSEADRVLTVHWSPEGSYAD